MTSHKEQPAVDTSAEKIARQIEKLEKRAAACRQTHNDFMAAEFEEYAASLRFLAAHPAEPAGAETGLMGVASRLRWWRGRTVLNSFAEKTPDGVDLPTELGRAADAFDRLSAQLRDAQARGKGMEEALAKIASHPEQDQKVKKGRVTESYGIGWAFHNIQSIARAALSRPEGSAST